MNTSNLAADEVLLLAHADVLTLLADLLRAPAAATLEELPALIDAAAWSDQADVVAAWNAMKDAVERTDAQAWSIEHHRLFEGATACPLNETAYIRRDKGAILGDLCGFYRAFNLIARTDSGEKPDHIVTELEFLALLQVMSAQALRTGQTEQHQITADAARSFARDHLADWLPLLIAQMRLTTPMPLMQCVAQVLECSWRAMAIQNDWAPLAEVQSHEPAFDVDAPAEECGAIADPVPLLVRGKTAADGPPSLVRGE